MGTHLLEFTRVRWRKRWVAVCLATRCCLRALPGFPVVQSRISSSVPRNAMLFARAALIPMEVKKNA